MINVCHSKFGGKCKNKKLILNTVNNLYLPLCTVADNTTTILCQKHSIDSIKYHKDATLRKSYKQLIVSTINSRKKV